MKWTFEKCLKQLSDHQDSIRRSAVRGLESHAESHPVVKDHLIGVVKSDTSAVVVDSAVTVLGRVCRGARLSEVATLLADLVASNKHSTETRRRAYIAFQQVLEARRTGVGFRSVEDMNMRAQQVLNQVNSIYKFDVDQDVDWAAIRRHTS